MRHSTCVIVLRRPITRLETDLESHWIYDTASNGAGQLAEAYTGTADRKDYRRLHTYDSLGRPDRSTQQLTDGSYTSQTSYGIGAFLNIRREYSDKEFDEQC